MTAMEEAIVDELNNLKSCLEKLSRERTQGNEWLRGYYKGQITAYEYALKLYDIQKKKEEK